MSGVRAFNERWSVRGRRPFVEVDSRVGTKFMGLPVSKGRIARPTSWHGAGLGRDGGLESSGARASESLAHEAVDALYSVQPQRTARSRRLMRSQWLAP